MNKYSYLLLIAILVIVLILSVFCDFKVESFNDFLVPFPNKYDEGETYNPYTTGGSVPDYAYVKKVMSDTKGKGITSTKGGGSVSKPLTMTGNTITGHTFQ